MTLLALLLGVSFIGGLFFDRHRRSLFALCLVISLGLLRLGTIG